MSSTEKRGFCAQSTGHASPLSQSRRPSIWFPLPKTQGNSDFARNMLRPAGPSRSWIDALRSLGTLRNLNRPVIKIKCQHLRNLPVLNRFFFFLRRPWEGTNKKVKDGLGGVIGP